MKKIVFTAIAVFSVCVLGISNASADVREGKWFMTIVTKAAGMGAAAAEAQAAMQNMSPQEQAMMQQMMGGMGMGMGAEGITTTIEKCITNADPVPPAEEGCRQTHTINGNTVNFETVCANGQSTGQVTYEGDSMSGSIMSHSSTGDANIELTGQYIGPC